MLKPLIRTLDRSPFELPLALFLGAAAAFATIAMPDALFGLIPGVRASNNSQLIQYLAAAAIGIAAVAAGYLAMRRSAKPHVPDLVETDDGQFEELTVERLVRLRRADSHPDAPPRQPIRASRDLGEPFMDVGGFPVAGQDEAENSWSLIPAADFVELTADTDDVHGAEARSIPMSTEDTDLSVEHPGTTDDIVDDAGIAEATVIEPVAMDAAAVEPANSPAPVVEGATDVPPLAVATAMKDDHVGAPSPALRSVLALPIEAFEPEKEPAPMPARPSRQSLTVLMDRLSVGLERRNGRPLGSPPVAALIEAFSRPRDTKPELREALDELNRLAGRRHS